MTELTVVTFDWVPELPRGFVRDLRIRWALEEAGLPYRIQAVPFEGRGAEHFAHQPFGQVPWLVDGELSVFESGAVLLHLGGRSEALLPVDIVGRNQAIEWVFAALNSVEMASLPWALIKFAGDDGQSPGGKFMENFVNARVGHLDAVLADREWLAGSFSIADILMVDVLRLVDRFGGLADYPNCAAYVARGVARPAFQKAYADQMAFYEAADRKRAGQG